MSARSLVVAVALVACGCGLPVEQVCPLRCGDRCIAANVCDAMSCPADAPCDPCSAQCRAACSPQNACKNPAEVCCSAGCADLAIDRWHCGDCDRACGVDADGCRDSVCSCGDGPPCGAG